MNRALSLCINHRIHTIMHQYANTTRSFLASTAASCCQHLNRQRQIFSTPLSVSFFSSAATNTRVEAAYNPRSDGIRIPSTTSVEDAIEAACSALLQRPPGPSERDLAERLKQHWFTSAGDLAEMTDTQATSLGVPLRLKYFITDKLITAAAAAPSSSSAFDSDHPPTNYAEQLEQLKQLEKQQQAKAQAQMEENWESLPIEERICPDKKRFGHAYASRPNVVSRGRATKYALATKDMPEGLANEVDALLRFGTQRFFGAQQEPVAEVTAQKYLDHVRGMLGWMHGVKGVPLDALTLRCLVPSTDNSAVALTFEYCQWLVNERGVNVRTELLALRSILFLTKFLYHSQSKAIAGEKAYGDLAVVKELRSLIVRANKESKVAPRVANEDMKWLEWPEYVALCVELKKECALRKSSKGADGVKERARAEVAWSLQTYLIFAILACVPDRQRTLRELEVGRTLIKDQDGRWVIRHSKNDYKTGKSYGQRPPLVINPAVYPELEAFISTWRSELYPEHGYLFTQANRQPFSDNQMCKLFMTTAYRVTGKRLTPHMVRDSIVTFLRRGNKTTERELEALALYMGHSVSMQRASYDRRTKEEKVEPAVNLLAAELTWHVNHIS